jgi:hypothetical protein
VTEYVPPVDGEAARIAWHGWVEGDANSRLDVIHAWLFEDLPGNRVRILTQESQKGVPAQELARRRTDDYGHQEWIGLTPLRLIRVILPGGALLTGPTNPWP